ncbi:hypothetical protein LCGC14_1367460 [marine sediment metagenome]|uniref:Uncharacterized protein n=1 Tax=marine sediment metagenome TaxID=412755 RepID=A0A0F9K6B4_9ZZZZ
MRHARTDHDRIQDPQNLIPEDEPVLLLRGQDAVAYQVVELYAQLLEGYGRDPELIASIRGQAHRMADWTPHKMPDTPKEYLVGPPVAAGAAALPLVDPIPRAPEAQTRVDGVLEQVGVEPPPVAVDTPDVALPLVKAATDKIVEAALAKDAGTADFSLPPEAQAQAAAALEQAAAQAEPVAVDLPDSVIEPVAEVTEVTKEEALKKLDGLVESDPLDDLPDLNDPPKEEPPSV